MALNKFIIPFFLLFTFPSHTKTLLPEFITKQDSSNLRLITHDGKFTYYQRRSGALLLSTNYNVKNILEGSVGSNYLVISSPARKKILIAQDKNLHSFLSLNKLKKIYSADFNGSRLILLGEGVNPQLHLDDTRMSFYNPYKKTITILKTHASGGGHDISIKSGRNPFFLPQVVMLDVNTILFTDLNAQGFPGIIKHSKNNKKSVNIYKAPSPNRKIELCKKNNQLIMGEFGLDPLESHGHISLLTPPDYKRTIIYKSSHNDIGNIICSIKGNFIYFIKRISSQTEVARLNIETHSHKVISDVSHATQIIDMDSNLLLPYQGKYYLLLGENDMTQFDLLKKRQQP